MALTLDDTQAATVLARLGLPDDTADVALVVDTVLDAVPDPAADSTAPSAVAASAARKLAPIGFDVVEHDTHEALKRDAAEGRRIAAAAAKAKIEAAVDDAVNKGKITAARRKHWVSLIQADPGMADVLASVPDETAVPLSELGHSADTNRDTADAGTGWFY